MTKQEDKNNKVEYNLTSTPPPSPQEQTISTDTVEHNDTQETQTKSEEKKTDNDINTHNDKNNTKDLDPKELKDLIIKHIDSKTIKDIRERSCSVSKIDDSTLYVDVIDK